VQPTLDPGCHKKVARDSPSDVLFHSLCKLFFVQLGGSTAVLVSCVRIRQQGRSTMLREEVGGRSVTPNLHCTELIELPTVQIGGSLGSSAEIIAGQYRKLT